MNSEAEEFSHGAVVSLKLTDFMQFNYVEFNPGATLNVILGPNGAGKSTIVNGIALALGAKTSVLGRADHIVDFIRTGCESATLDIEIYNEFEEANYLIRRKIFRLENDERDRNHTKHTKWFMNGATVGPAKILKLVKELNIQPENLCQFLPQDKVHDFSKMNSKELLVKTVDAVGNTELKNDHIALKELQSALSNSEDRRQKKLNTLEDLRKQADDKEEAVRNYETKTKIERQMKLLSQRADWARVEDARKIVRERQKIRDQAKRDVDAVEIKLAPLQKELKKVINDKSKIDGEITKATVNVKQIQAESRNRTLRMEEIPDTDLVNLQNEFEALKKREDEKQEQLRAFEEDVEKLRDEYNQALENTDDRSQALESKCRKLEIEMEQVNQNKTSIEHEVRQKNYERKNVLSRLRNCKEELVQLNNVNRQKLQTIRNNLPNGDDAVKAYEWLQINRGEFNGNVYGPILMCIDVIDAGNNAKYLENTIPYRDLVAFAAEDKDDANKLMHQFRDGMNLRVNVIHTDPNKDPNPPVRTNPDGSGGELSDENKRKYGFKGYLNDMITCPDAVKAYLCESSCIHEVPVFDKKADSYMEELVQDLKLFFAGDTRYQVVKSRYSSGARSTSSSNVGNRNLLRISLDKSKISELNKEEKKLEKECVRLDNEKSKKEEILKEQETELESKKRELKFLQQKMQEKKYLKSRLNLKENQLVEFKKSMKPIDLKIEEDKMAAKKAKLSLEMVKLAGELTNMVIEMSQKRQKIDLLRSSVQPFERKEQQLKTQLEDLRETSDNLNEKLGEETETLDHRKREFLALLKKAKENTGNGYKADKPPRELIDDWTQHGYEKFNYHLAMENHDNLERQNEGLDTVERDEVIKYHKMREAIEGLEEELADHENQVEEDKANIQTIRERWVERLEELVAQISNEFSALFEYMGFSGCVKLNKGTHEDDFQNYGFDVFVKFRSALPLTRLDGSFQSGGERSVSTALYMMALQALTKVPFRCVDEINQGMDERNERRVFDLLIETSVKKNSAQYFLLTPKLLPNLNYGKGVKILVVHNGAKMCKNNKWNMDNFKAIARARKNA